MIMASGLAIFFKFLTLEGLCNRQVMTKNSEIDLSIERTRKSALQFYINVNKNSISDRRSWNQGQWKMSVQKILEVVHYGWNIDEVN